MKYIRLLKKILFEFTQRLNGFWGEIAKELKTTRKWKCSWCDSKKQSLDNEYICQPCRDKQKAAFPEKKPVIMYPERTHFDLCNQAVEIPLTFKNMELDGKLNTPELRQLATDMIERSKRAQKIDYQVEGHPSFD